VSKPTKLLAVFVKQPVPGQVKTRLGAHIGHEAACELYTAFQYDTLTAHGHLADRLVVYFAPETVDSRAYFAEVLDTRDVHPQTELWAQPDGDLGERLRSVFQLGLKAADRVVVIGSDSPTLPSSLVASAFEQLESHAAVVGPAMDGGYYLLGLSQSAEVVFEGIDWSTSRVLLQTLVRLEAAKLSTYVLPPWYDVDEVNDLVLLHAGRGRGRVSQNGETSRTTEILDRLWPTAAALEQFLEHT